MLLHVEMNKVPVTMDLDTGAPCSITEEETWMMLRRPTLRLTVVTLQVYGTGQKLRTLCSSRVEMQLNGHKEKVDVFVIQAPGYPCLFGRDLLEKFLVDWKALKTMATTTTTMKPLAINALSLTEVKGKFLKLGRATTAKAHLELRPDARSKFMKPRSVPFALKAKIENDLQRLVDMGVLQPITRSEWASLIVPVLKSDGQSGYAADWYPLPSNKDFFATLSGGTVFSRLDLSDAYLKIEMEETAKKCLVINTHKVCLGWLTTITSIVYPLYALLYENVVWSWKPACDKAWKALRTALISLDVLMHYNSELPVRLECDACGYGIGAGLSHILPHGSHHSIVFSSKTLSKAEKNYSQIECKALTPVFDVQKFHRYLFRRKFTLVTDYKPLLLDFGRKDTLRPPNEHHANADYLSRNPIHVIEDECLQDATPTVVVSIAFLDERRADPERYLVHPWVIPEKPWQRLHMDFCGPMFNRIWLVFIDTMTKWPGIVCFKNYLTEGMLLRQLHQEVQRFFLTYRTAQHLRTYASLSELLMSRKIRTQWDLLKPDTVKKEKTTGEKVDHQKNESYRLHDKFRQATPISPGPLSFTTKPSGSKRYSE
ncbi:conserved hypothetical protein [Trichinella spiralis]|uniref:hypothetical protein n=1 Tax=Trichinella spiralis TaxID=6334 RepID=UPI0001EFBB63|nr:conserved hypothetical protein [Trichinella spiralis]